MAAIMEALCRDHRNIEHLLRILERELGVFDRAGRPDYEIIGAIVDYFQIYPDRIHHPKEDLVLAKLKDRDPQAAASIGNLEGEHEGMAARLRRFANVVELVLKEQELSRKEFNHIASEFIDHERRHMEMEEKHFFPVALEVLTTQDWAELDARLTDEADPLFSEDIRQKFKSLRQRITFWEKESQA